MNQPPIAPHVRLASNLHLEPKNWALLEGNVHIVSFTTGTVLFAPHRACEGFIVLEQGMAKVLVTAPNGRQIVLYHLGVGESCIVTTACLMANADYDAEAIATSAGSALFLRKDIFEQLLNVSPLFRAHVFAGFAVRLSSVVRLMQTALDKRIDARLAGLLAASSPELKLTQYAIAQELGTAREVVSRHLKDFALKGLIKPERGRILILHQDRLLHIAGKM